MTIYALSSGPGISGIAVIRISGGETSKVVRAMINVSWKFFGWKIEINSPPIIAPAPSSEVKNPARYGLTSKRSKKITAISAKYGNANILKMGVRHKTRMIDCFCLA